MKYISVAAGGAYPVVPFSYFHSGYLPEEHTCVVSVPWYAPDLGADEWICARGTCNPITGTVYSGAALLDAICLESRWIFDRFPLTMINRMFCSGKSGPEKGKAQNPATWGLVLHSQCLLYSLAMHFPVCHRGHLSLPDIICLYKSSICFALKARFDFNWAHWIVTSLTDFYLHAHRPMRESSWDSSKAYCWSSYVP